MRADVVAVSNSTFSFSAALLAARRAAAGRRALLAAAPGTAPPRALRAVGREPDAQRGDV